MITVALAILILALVIMAMAVGVIVGGKPIKGSCGGMSALGIDKACDICGGNTAKCEEEQDRQAQEKTAHTAEAKTSLAYEANSRQKSGDLK